MKNNYNLTRKQQQVLDYLIENQEHFSQPPTLDELCFAMGLKSRGSMHKHIQALIDAGLVEAPNRKQRGVRLIARMVEQVEFEPNSSNDKDYQQQGTPFVGSIAAGSPIEALENICYMHIPEQIKTEKPCYILQVKGDSMIEAGIFDGDWVVVEQSYCARNGDCVVALVNKTDATLKYIEQYPHETVLIPANKNMQSMHFNPQQVEVQGVLVGQMRSYK